MALAILEACQLVTVDRKLHDKLAVDYGSLLLWVEDIPAAHGGATGES
jgi:hypothetical protein